VAGTTTIVVPSSTATLATTADVPTSIVDNGNATAITIDSSENVGIGTASPASNLHVNRSVVDGVYAVKMDTAASCTLHLTGSDPSTGSVANGSGVRMKITNSDTTNDNYSQIEFRESNDSVTSLIVGKNVTHSATVASGSLHFLTSNAGTLTDNLEITKDGRGLSQFTAKAWINFNGSGTVSIRDSHNISSVTDNSVGKFTCNFTNNMGNDGYFGTFSNNYDGPGWLGAFHTSSIQVVNYHGGGYHDPSRVTVLVFGD